MAGIFGRKTNAAGPGTKSSAPRIIEQYTCEPCMEGKAHILSRHNANYASLMAHCAGYDNNLCFVGSDERIEIFGIQCKCGSRLVGIAGNKLEEMELLGDPISILCPVCGERYEIFDSTRQGYDGELGISFSDETGYSEKKAVCAQCGNDTFELTLGFEYPDDIEDTARDEKKEAKDLYTWLTGCAKCDKCGAMADIIDFECA